MSHDEFVHETMSRSLADELDRLVDQDDASAAWVVVFYGDGVKLLYPLSTTEDDVARYESLLLWALCLTGGP
jgi:hypothetical protein